MTMDAEAPKCPTCGSVVQAHWDWCHLCGFDPDHLKPVGWIPAEPAVEQPAKGRRKKRAAKADAKAEAKSQREPAVSPIAPLVSPLAPDPGTPVVSAIVPPLVPAPPAAPPTGQAGEKVFHVPPCQLEMAAATVMFAVAAGLVYLAVRGVIQVADGASTSMLDNVSTVFFILVCAVVAFGLVAQGLALLRQKVVLTATEIVAHNRFGKARHAPRDEIYALHMSQRQYTTPRGLSSPLDVPYLQLSDGSGFWLDALGAQSPLSSPTDEQLAQFEQLTNLVESHRTSGVS